MLKVVHANRETEADLLIGLAMGRNPLPAGVRFLHERAALVGRHAIDEEDLDDVGTRLDKLPDLGARIGRIGNGQQLARRRALIGRHFRQRRSRGIDGGSRQPTTRDPLLDSEDRVRWRREVPHAGHASHQHLPGRRRDRDALEIRRVPEPCARIGMTAVDQMHVQIPEAREHGQAFGRNLLVAGWHCQRCRRADAFDPIASHQDHAVAYRTGARAVDQRAADKRERRRRLRGGTFTVHRSGRACHQQQHDTDTNWRHRAGPGWDFISS